jgi:putative hemolysin
MLFNIKEHLHTPVQRGLYKMAGPLLEKSLAFRDFEDTYRRTRELYRRHRQHPSTLAWFESVLQAIDASYDVDVPADFEVPAGPLVVVSNHPFGIMDPCVLAAVVAKHRPDLKVMTNSLLAAMEEIRPHIIAVDPFGGSDAAKKNLGPMKEAIRFLRDGGALAIFPSGEVSHYKPGRGVTESPWSPHVGSLVRRTKASVLPVFFPGCNSVLFHAMGLMHPRLRTGMLFREFCARKKSVTKIRLGSVIAHSKLRKFEDDDSLTKYLRLHTLLLAQRAPHAPEPAAKSSLPGPAGHAAAPHPIIAVPPADRFRAEVRQLEERGALIASQNNLSAFVASANEIPRLLQEIGRLREETFRAVGEGTGEDVDLDSFDRYYLHLFLWDDEKGRIAGAYRMGLADVILREYGKRGLYTNTLFRFEKPFLSHLGCAIEMGRSFVTLDYQRNLAALPLLWKGVLRWVARNPQYKRLFGPVSISTDYGKLSRTLMVEFLEDKKLHPDLSALVKPRKPFRYSRNKKLLKEFISAQLQDVDDCSALISSLETDGKGIPTLLKHYLRLNGTILSFNVDKAFSSVLDGLIMVDLTESDPKLLGKYMGEEHCRDYLAKHNIHVPARGKP